MQAYLISYDLDKPGQDYSALTRELESLGAIRVLYSEWILNSDSSAKEVRDHLQRYVDGNDMLLVLKLTGEAAWTRLMISGDAFKQAISL